MTRLSGLLLSLLFAVAPTVDMVCRATCTPVPMTADASSCHEDSYPTADAVLLAAVACRFDAVTAVAPTEGARNLVAPAPLLTAQVTTFAHVLVSTGAGLRRHALRPRLPHGYPSTIVLRI